VEPAPGPHRVSDAGRFDLDDLGAVIGEQVPAERSADDVADLEHP
jgi:hypothetical protein